MPETLEEMKVRIANQKVKPGEKKIKPLEDYDPTKPKPVASPVPKPSPAQTEDADMPKMEDYPGLAGRAAYNAAMNKYKKDKEAKKAGQMKAMKEPAQ